MRASHPYGYRAKEDIRRHLLIFSRPLCIWRDVKKSLKEGRDVIAPAPGAIKGDGEERTLAPSFQ